MHDGSYKSLLHLTNVSILDIGYYYCCPKSENISKNEETFKKIYIFVQGNNTKIFYSIN